MSAIQIHPFEENHWPAVWQLLQTTFATGDTYAFAPQSPEADIYRAWVQTPSATFVASKDSGDIVGTYFIKPNQPGLGSHVCNCGYVVDASAQGQGVASAMCEHSQRQAVALGFRAMQFNLVVQSNARAIRLWQKLGFSIVGTLPGAFLHARLGYVDALVMFKTLKE